uniref:Uncharacterized protein n=1 Tax=Anguilla anguilla TaxID=7936 RepID=A0A0E9TIX3_ANGAN
MGSYPHNFSQSEYACQHMTILGVIDKLAMCEMRTPCISLIIDTSPAEKA